MASPVRPKTKQTSIRVETGFMERTERVIEHLLREQPHLRPFLTSLPAMYRLMLERGINAYEAELGLGAMDAPDEAPKKPAKSRKAG